MKPVSRLRVLAIALSLLLCLSAGMILPAAEDSPAPADEAVSYYNGTADTSWFTTDFEGYDETTKTYTLSTAAQLAGLAKVCTATNNFSGQTVKLAKDMVFNRGEETTYAWSPIANFCGTFDGDGHLVSGLYYNGSAKDIGFFSTSCSGIKVRNLAIVNTSFTTTDNRCGAVIGASTANAVYEDLYVEATIKSANQAGGIIGQGGGTVRGCVFSGTVTATASYAGGVSGEDNGQVLTVSDFVNLGDITAKTNRAGGVSGQLRTTGEKVTRALNVGTVSGSISGVIGGRIALKNYAITDCVYVSDGTVKVYGDLNGGGGTYTETNCRTFKAVSIKGQAIWEQNGWVAMKGDYPMPSQAVSELAVRVDIFENGKTKSDELSLLTLTGASMRLSDPSGLRFETAISKEAYDALLATYGKEKIRLGTLIAPAAFVQEAGAFTKEALGALEKDSVTYLDVTADGFRRTEGDTYVFAGSVTGILDANKTLQFMAIGYIEIDGTIYYSRTTAQRCVSEVAIAALKDTQTASGGEYLYPMTVNGTVVYSYLTETERKTAYAFAVWGDDTYGEQISWN